MSLNLCFYTTYKHESSGLHACCSENSLVSTGHTCATSLYFNHVEIQPLNLSSANWDTCLVNIHQKQRQCWGFGCWGGSHSLIRYLVEQLGLNLSHKENRVFVSPKLLKRLYRFSNDIPVHSISTGCSTLTQSRWAPSCHTWRGTNLTWQKWVGISTLLIKIGGSRKKHF